MLGYSSLPSVPKIPGLLKFKGTGLINSSNPALTKLASMINDFLDILFFVKNKNDLRMYTI